MKRHIGKLSAALATAGVLLAQSPAQAQQTLTLGLYGGSFEKIVREVIVPAFIKNNPGVKFEYLAGNSTDTLARMRAQQAKQEIDVAIMDDGVMFQAVKLGFCAPLAAAPVMNDVYDLAKVSGNRAVGIGFIATGLVYNAKYFADQKLPAPTSWRDLLDPKFRKKVVMSPISGTYGLHALVMMARIDGGSEDKIDPGFALMKKAADNVLTFTGSPAALSETLQRGDAVIGVWGNARVTALANTGFPAKFVYPKEGAVALLSAVCPVVNSDVPELAQKFVQHLLSDEMQSTLAKDFGFGPVNMKVKLAPEVAATVLYGPEAVAKMVAVDWDKINTQREAWTQRWNREIER